MVSASPLARIDARPWPAAEDVLAVLHRIDGETLHLSPKGDRIWRGMQPRLAEELAERGVRVLVPVRPHGPRLLPKRRHMWCMRCRARTWHVLVLKHMECKRCHPLKATETWSARMTSIRRRGA